MLPVTMKVVPTSNFGEVLCTNIALQDEINLYMLNEARKKESFVGKIVYNEWKQQVHHYLLSEDASKWFKPQTVDRAKVIAKLN